MVLKYEDYFDIKHVKEVDPWLDIENFKQDFFNKIYSNKYSTDKDVVFSDDNLYNLVLKEENAFSLTNQKTMKALINFLLQIRELEVAKLYIDKTKNNFETGFVSTVYSRIYYEQGKYDLALEKLPKKLDNYDKCELAGNIYEKKEMYEDSIKSFEKALHYKVVCEIYQKIGRLYLKTDRDAKGIQNLLMAHNVNFKNKDVIRDISAYYYNKGDYRQAANYLNMIRKDLDSSKYYGIALFVNGEKTKAKRVLKGYQMLVENQEVDELMEQYSKISSSEVFDVVVSAKEMSYS